jgi:hypothetical protein
LVLALALGRWVAASAGAGSPAAITTTQLRAPSHSFQRTIQTSTI